jgi:hypothetical protein
MQPPRPLLNAEALTRPDDDAAFTCTCNGDPCPLCGVAEASPYCSLHNGDYLKRELDERTEVTTAEEIEARAGELLDEMDLDDLLEERSFDDLMQFIAEGYPEALREWIDGHVEVGMSGPKGDRVPAVKNVRGL